MVALKVQSQQHPFHEISNFHPSLKMHADFPKYDEAIFRKKVHKSTYLLEKVFFRKFYVLTRDVQ